MIQIQISFNPFKWIYLKSKSIFLDFKSNPLIGYRLDMDWIHFLIIQIAFWVGFWHGPIQVEPRQSRPRKSKVSPSPRQVESSGPKSNRVGMSPGRCHAERTQTDVEPSGPGPMSIREGSSRCRSEWARTDVKSYGPDPMSIRTGLGRCRFVKFTVHAQ